jgi:hypothetical protein
MSADSEITPRSAVAGDKLDASLTAPRNGYSTSSVRWKSIGNAAEVALVAALALSVRLVFLDHTPHEDEINHVLAARALIEDGSRSIAGGPPYDRAWVYTYLVAGMLAVFGDSLVVARLPAVAFGSLLIVGLFLWVRAVAGRTGAWVAALLLVFSPVGIEQSQWVRFYTLQALLVFVAAAAAYRLLSPPPLPRAEKLGVMGAACGAILLAVHLQITTAVAVAGLLLWTGLIIGRRQLVRIRDRRARLRIVLAAATLAVVLAVAFAYTETAGTILERLRFADMWAEANRYNFRFYHFLLLDQYPALWATFPLAILAALAFRPRAALLCTCMFGIALVFHSVAAWKAERYIFYALPFFFALWGIAIQAALPWARGRVGALLAWSLRRPVSLRSTSAATYAFLIGCALFMAAGSGAASYSYKMLTVSDADWRWFLVAPYRGWPDWEAAARELEPVAREAEVVLASSEINALWALGRVDLILRRSRRTAVLSEFERWWKVPVPVISTAESLNAVMACNESGLVVIERNHWRNDWGVPAATADFILERLERVPLSDRYRLMAFTWEHAGGRTPKTCPTSS